MTDITELLSSARDRLLGRLEPRDEDFQYQDPFPHKPGILSSVYKVDKPKDVRKAGVHGLMSGSLRVIVWYKGKKQTFGQLEKRYLTERPITL